MTECADNFALNTKLTQMKRTFYLAVCAAALLMAACENTTEPEKALSTDTIEVTFPKEGGTRTINLGITGLDIIDAYPSSSWIEVSGLDKESGTLMISAGPTSEINDLEGKVIIYSELDETLSVKVKQEGNGIIYDRSTAELMNLHGNVKEVSFFFDPTYIWEQNASYLYNLRFNEKGMITHMEYFYLYTNKKKITCECDLEYDSQDRLTDIDVKTDGVVSMEDMTPFEYSISLEYGEHGKYIATDRIFGFLEENQTWTWYRIWLPKMIRDLSKLTIHNNVITPSEFTIDIEVNGEEGTAYLNTGSEAQQLNKYTFIGQYTSTIDFLMNFAGIATVESRMLYETEKESGYVTRIAHTATAMGDLPISEKTYSTDLCNPLMKYEDNLNYNYEMTIERNGNNDITAINETKHELEATYSYEYDEYGNWTSINEHTLSIEATWPFETEREILYY